MDCDNPSSIDATRKMELSCNCSHTCVCNKDNFVKEYDNKPTKQHHSEVACYWSSYPFWPWTPSWFENSMRVEYDAIYHREMDASIEKKTAVVGSSSSSTGTTMFPTQSRRVQNEENASIPKHLIMPPPPVAYVGNPVFKIMKFRLPPHFFPLLDYIVEECSKYATSLPDGWMWVITIIAMAFIFLIWFTIENHIIYQLLLHCSTYDIGRISTH